MKFEVRDAKVGWSQDDVAQRYVNFSVESGEVLCMLGPNGCGKTTLLKSVLGLIPMLGGLATIDGEDVRKMSAKHLARAVAYVPQAHRPPFPYTVRDVVVLGRAGKLGTLGTPEVGDYAATDRVLKELGIYELRNELYTDISGGELQLVLIAKALVQEPLMLVLDEPTAALDFGNAARVINVVRDLAAQGYAVVMTTHSPDHAFLCDSNVLLLQRAAPPKFGRAIEVITGRNMLAAYGLGVRVGEFVNPEGKITRMCIPQL